MTLIVSKEARNLCLCMWCVCVCTFLATARTSDHADNLRRPVSFAIRLVPSPLGHRHRGTYAYAGMESPVARTLARGGGVTEFNFNAMTVGQ